MRSPKRRCVSYNSVALSRTQAAREAICKRGFSCQLSIHCGQTWFLLQIARALWADEVSPTNWTARGQTRFLPPLQASRPLWAGEETKQQVLLEAPGNQWQRCREPGAGHQRSGKKSCDLSRVTSECLRRLASIRSEGTAYPVCATRASKPPGVESINRKATTGKGCRSF